MEKNVYLNKVLILLSLMIVLNSFTYADDLTTNIDTYWKMENTTDSTGNYSDFSVTGATSGVVGIINNSYNYNTDDYLTFTGDDFVATKNVFTINIWINTNTPTTAQLIIGSIDGSTAVNGWTANINSDASILWASSDSVGWDAVLLGTPGTVIVNTWHMVTIVRNVSAWELYFDGSSQITDTDASSINDNNVTYIGSRVASGRDFNGEIDEFAVWNRPLTPIEITELYNAGSPGTDQQYPFGIVTPILNLSTSLFYPINGSSYMGNYNGSIIINYSNNNNTLDCELNDTRFTYISNTTTSFLFQNNTVINDEMVSFSYYCNDSTGHWSNSTGLFFNKYNVLLINMYDENTGILINNKNITLDLSNSTLNYSYYNTTDTGKFNITQIPQGTFEAVFSSLDYTTRTYTTTTGYGDITTLDAFLTNESTEVVFTIADSISGRALEGATMTIQRKINGSWVSVAVINSDITGRILLDFNPLSAYNFYVSLSGYTDKTFTLNPIIFNSYQVYMEKFTELIDESTFSGVLYYITPHVFYEGWNNLSVTISKAEGDLSYYGVSFTFPGGYNGSNLTNSYGSSFTIPFYINGSDFKSRVNLTAFYKLVGDNQRTLNYAFEIIPNPTIGTLMSNRDKTYGMTLFERVLLATIIIIALGGIATYFSTAIIGGTIGLFVMGYLSYIGLLSAWLVYVPIFVGTLIIIKVSTK